MFTSKSSELQATLNAMDKSQAIIEFNMDGTIITANQNFLNALGYSLEEIRGKHHSMFVNDKERNSTEYRQFWENSEPGQVPGRRISAHRQGRQGDLDSGDLQSRARLQRQAVQGREVRDRHHGAQDAERRL